jgi:hypothetical protein
MILTKCPNNPLIITGDFNVNLLDYAKRLSSEERELIDTIVEEMKIECNTTFSYANSGIHASRNKSLIDFV